MATKASERLSVKPSSCILFWITEAEAGARESFGQHFTRGKDVFVSLPIRENDVVT